MPAVVQFHFPNEHSEILYIFFFTSPCMYSYLRTEEKTFYSWATCFSPYGDEMISKVIFVATESWYAEITTIIASAPGGCVITRYIEQ